MKELKKLFVKIFAIIVILIIIASPFLLIIDMKKYSPFVFLVWLLSIASFIFKKKKSSDKE